MPENLSDPADRLRWARNRAGYPDAASFARKVQMAPVTYRAYEAGQNGFAKHAATFARELDVSAAWLLEGGTPPEGAPVLPAPAELASTARPFQMEGASLERMTEDVPVYGTVLGADEIIDGEAVEQTTLNSGDVIAYFKRPAILNGRADIYGVFVAGSSMDPRYSEGEAVFVETKRPPRIGDDVVVYLRDTLDEQGERDTSVLIKRLIRRTSSHYELQQFNPPLIFKIDATRVSKVHRVISYSELLS